MNFFKRTTELTKIISSALSIAQKCAEMITKTNIYPLQISIKEKRDMEKQGVNKVEIIKLELGICFLTLNKNERLNLKSNGHRSYPLIKGGIIFRRGKESTPKLELIDLKITKYLPEEKNLFFIYFPNKSPQNKFSDWLTEEEKGDFEEFVIHFLNDVF